MYIFAKLRICRTSKNPGPRVLVLRPQAQGSRAVRVLHVYGFGSTSTYFWHTSSSSVRLFLQNVSSTLCPEKKWAL